MGYRPGLRSTVKMAGYWPALFFSVFMTEMDLRLIKSQKKNKADIKPS